MDFLMAQWLRISLAMKGTGVQSTAGELRIHVLWSDEAYAIPTTAPHAPGADAAQLESPCTDKGPA